MDRGPGKQFGTLRQRLPVELSIELLWTTVELAAAGVFT